MALKTVRFANLFLTGALTGNKFGSWAVLHSALRELPQQAHVAGMLCYAAMLAITLTGNIPINRRTLELDPDTTSREEFLALQARWDRLHAARNVLNLAGFASAILGVLTSSQDNK